MLDAYIIDRIRKQREQKERDGDFIPLHIEPPRPSIPLRRPAYPQDKRPERGITEIDFHV